EEILEEKKREDDAEVAFNEDLVCQHGGLCLSEGERRLISDTAWHKLKEYFSLPLRSSNTTRIHAYSARFWRKKGSSMTLFIKEWRTNRRWPFLTSSRTRTGPTGGAWPQVGPAFAGRSLRREAVPEVNLFY
ncbi:unnamed protein product, partial [Staurois parvus]